MCRDGPDSSLGRVMRQPPPEIPGLSFVQRLGSGGFADVHLYRQELPQMLVAVKVLRTASGDLREQLVAEANTMAELAEHPYIVTILRADVTEDGRPYLVMAYYPRPNLSARAKAAPLSVAETLRTGVQLASAVETAHRAGVLHRDIKPANVLVTSYGTPALADFGVAGRAGLVDEEDEVGVSIAWAPPEVLTGRSNGSVAADVYSLTATLSYLLTGRTPFEAVGGDNSQDALLARTVREPLAPTGRSDVPPALEQLLRTGMAKDPAHRPPDAMSLAIELQRVEQSLGLPRTEIVVLDEREGLHTETGGPTTVRPVALVGDATPVGGRTPVLPAGVEPDRIRRARWPWLVAAGAAALLLAGGVTGGFLLLREDPSDETTSAADAPTTSSVATSTPTTDGSPSSSSSSSPASESSPTTQGAAGELDPCLVGTWEVARHEEQIPLAGTLTDLERTMTFAKDGRLTIVYEDSRPKGAGSGMVFDGTVVYDVGTSEGRMTFDLVEDDLDVTMMGSPIPSTPGTQPVDYTCEGDTFTETSAVIDAEYRRR